MKIFKIISDKEGMGKEVNHYDQFDQIKQYDAFEQTVQHLPVYDSKGNKVPAGEYEAELVVQIKFNTTWYDSIEPTAYNKDSYRRIYRTIEPEPKEASPENHFYLKTDEGNIAHVNMNPNADKETFEAVKTMIDRASKMPSKVQEPKVQQQGERESLEQAAEYFANIQYDLGNCRHSERRYIAGVFEAGANWQKHQSPIQQQDFQSRVLDWLIKCFGTEIAKDVVERNDRFIEESLELAQSLNYSADRAHALVDYVFNRPKGEAFQEVGGVMVTLAALCSATGLDMAMDGEIEYARINKPEIIEKIRKKQAAKPTGSALPVVQQQAGEIKTAEDVLADMIDIMPYKLPIKSLAYIVEALNHFATLKNAELQKEVERLKEALIKIRDWDGTEHQKMEIATRALNQ